jgi:hypothetical protein
LPFGLLISKISVFFNLLDLRRILDHPSAFG